MISKDGKSIDLPKDHFFVQDIDWTSKLVVSPDSSLEAFNPIVQLKLHATNFPEPTCGITVVSTKMIGRMYSKFPPGYITKSTVKILIGGASVFVLYETFSGNEKFHRKEIMPLVHKYVDAETAHRLGVRLAKSGLLKYYSENHKEYEELVATVFDKHFKNPIGIAAGFDKDGEAIEGLRNSGLGFVEIGSVTPLPQEGNSKPRIFRLLEDKGVINRYGFNSAGVGEVSINVQKAFQPNAAVPLGVNLVVNVSSPNTPGLRSLQNKDQLIKNQLTIVDHSRIDTKMDMESEEPPACDGKMQRKVDIFKGTVIISFDGKIVTHPNLRMEHMQKCYAVHPEIGRLWIGATPEALKTITSLTEKYKGPLTCSMVEIEFTKGQQITAEHKRLLTEQLKVTDGLRLSMGPTTLASLMTNAAAIDAPNVLLWKLHCKVRHLWSGSEQEMISFIFNRNASNEYRLYFDFQLPDSWSSFVQHYVENFESHSNPARIMGDVSFLEPRCQRMMIEGRAYLKMRESPRRYIKVIGYPSYEEYSMIRADQWRLLIAYYDDGAINFEVTKKGPDEEKKQTSSDDSSDDGETDFMLAGPKEEEDESDESMLASMSGVKSNAVAGSNASTSAF